MILLGTINVANAQKKGNKLNFFENIIINKKGKLNFPREKKGEKTSNGIVYSIYSGTENPGVKETSITKPKIDWASGTCVTKKIKLENDFSAFNILNSSAINNTRLYPGAIFKQDDIINGSYGLAPNIQRNKLPLAITIELLSKNNDADIEIIGEIDGGKVLNAKNELLRRANGNQVVAAMQLDFSSASDKKAFSIEAGAGVSIPDAGFSFDSNVSGSSSSSSNFLRIKFYQPMYSIFVPTEKIPSLVSPSSITSDLMVIDQVTYGRMMYLIIKSNDSKEDMELNMNSVFTHNGVSASASANIKNKIEKSNYEFKVIGYGGNNQKLANIIAQGFTNNFVEVSKSVSEWIKDSQWNDKNIAYPISYSMSYVQDGKIASMKASCEEITIRDCYPLLPGIRLGKGYFQAKKVIDFGDDEELYGNVKLKVTYKPEGKNTREVYNNYNNISILDVNKSDAKKIKKDVMVYLNEPLKHIDFRKCNTIEELESIEFEFNANIRDVIEGGLEWVGTTEINKNRGYAQYESPSYTIKYNNVIKKIFEESNKDNRLGGEKDAIKTFEDGNNNAACMNVGWVLLKE